MTRLSRQEQRELGVLPGATADIKSVTPQAVTFEPARIVELHPKYVMVEVWGRVPLVRIDRRLIPASVEDGIAIGKSFSVQIGKNWMGVDGGLQVTTWADGSKQAISQPMKLMFVSRRQTAGDPLPPA